MGYYDRLSDRIIEKTNMHIRNPALADMPDFKNTNYDRKFLNDKVGDKLRWVKNIAVRNTPSFMMKGSKTNDIMVMEEAQRIINDIAKKNNLMGVFAPEKAAVDAVNGVMEEEDKNGNPKASEVQAEINEQVAETTEEGEIKKTDEELLEEDIEEQKKAAEAESKRVKTLSNDFKNVKGTGFTVDQRRAASGIRHAQKDADETTADDIAGYVSTGAGLASKAASLGGTAVSAFMEGELADTTSKISGGVGAGLSYVGNLIDTGRQAAQFGKEWDDLNGLDRLERGMGFAENVSKGFADGFRMGAAGTSMKEMAAGDLSGWTSGAEGVGTAISGLGSAVTNQMQMQNIREQEKKTKKTKTWGKAGENDTSSAVERGLAKQKAVYDEVLATTGDEKKAKAERNKVAKNQASYYRKRNAEHMAKSARSDKRNRGMVKLASGLLGAAFQFAGAGTGNKFLRWAGTGLSMGTDFIGGLVADIFQGKAQAKTIDREMKALKLAGGDTAKHLERFEDYNDLKKFFKFEYTLATINAPPALRSISDADFKTLMSNALSGQSGGKAGIANALAITATKSLMDDAKDENEVTRANSINTMKAMGANIGRDENWNVTKMPRAGALAKLMSTKHEAGLGEYTSHQFAPGA